MPWSASVDVDLVYVSQMATENVLPSVQPFHAMAYPLSLAEMQQVQYMHAFIHTFVLHASK